MLLSIGMGTTEPTLTSGACPTAAAQNVNTIPASEQTPASVSRRKSAAILMAMTTLLHNPSATSANLLPPVHAFHGHPALSTPVRRGDSSKRKLPTQFHQARSVLNIRYPEV